MLFNSIHFLIFLPVVSVLFYVLPHRFRWLMLLLASYVFYALWNPDYAFLLLSTSFLNFFSALEIQKQQEKKDRRFLLIISLVFNVGLLFFFKYFNFLSQSMNILTDFLGLSLEFPLLDILLPIGLSFYIFQMLGYTIDIYRGKQKAEKHFGRFALYVAFFPKLLMGPIERYNHLGPQLARRIGFNFTHVINGLRLILYGLFLKMVIADNLDSYVDQIFSSPVNFSRIDILTGCFFYSIQIYTDLQAYALIAIGSALILGIKLSDNFNSPYFSRSIREFWQRWFITLTSWFRDYFYLSLDGRKKGRISWVLNFILVSLLFALWHGPRFTFLIWVGIFAFFYLLEYFISADKSVEKEGPFKVRQLLNVFIIFLIVSFAWVFFRSESLADAMQMITYAVKEHDYTEQLHVSVLTWILLGLFVLIESFLYNTRYDKAMGKLPRPLRWVNYAFLLFAIIVFASPEHIPFIYFQF